MHPILKQFFTSGTAIWSWCVTIVVVGLVIVGYILSDDHVPVPTKFIIGQMVQTKVGQQIGQVINT